jgi:putative transcriptional regulator
LLYIPPGQAVPDHSHNGLELTLVLQGSFSDETGRFGVGDLEIADQDLEHTPIADAGPPCICLAATDAPLRFNALLPRLLQPLFKI